MVLESSGPSGRVQRGAEDFFRGRDAQGCLEDSVLPHASGAEIAAEARFREDCLGAGGIEPSLLAQEQVRHRGDFPEFEDANPSCEAGPVATGASPPRLKEALGGPIRSADDAGTHCDLKDSAVALG